jgi:hypothetical protein
MNTKVPLLAFLQKELLHTEKPQSKHVLFELGEAAETTTYFFQLLRNCLQKQWGVVFGNSKNNCEADLFSTNAKSLWISNFALECEEEPSSKSSLKDMLAGNLPDITFVLVKKVLAKDMALLGKHNFIIVHIEQKKFCLRDFYQTASELLRLNTAKNKNSLILDTFGTSYFSELDQLVSFVSSLFVLSANNFTAFKKTYTSSFFKENCFKLTQYLLGDRSNAAKFFALWQELCADFPIQFWTSFLMNRVWANLPTSQINNTLLFEKQRQLYMDLYLADLSSKQINMNIFLEPIFYSYFTSESSKST